MDEIKDAMLDPRPLRKDGAGKVVDEARGHRGDVLVEAVDGRDLRLLLSAPQTLEQSDHHLAAQIVAHVWSDIPAAATSSHHAFRNEQGPLGESIAKGLSVISAARIV